MELDRNSWETRASHLVGSVMQRAPWGVCRRTGWWFGLALFKALKSRRKVAIGNVQRAFPHLTEAAARQVARRSVQNAAMTLFEFMRLSTATRDEVMETVIDDGSEHVREALAGGRGVLLLTAHFGNWELLAAGAALHFPLSLIARPVSNQGLEDQILMVRRKFNVEVISKHDAGRATLDALRKNRTLAITPDQHAGAQGLLLPFFGHPTRMVSSLARLAMLSGAPVVPAFGVRKYPWISDGRTIARIRPGFTVENDRKRRDEMVLAGTQRMTAELENIIRLYPDQWLWLHKRWRDEDAMQN